METVSAHFGSIEEVRSYVHQKLCDKSHLEMDQFPLGERRLVRAGTSCGVYFSLRGPNAMHASAIWDVDQAQILFYGARGDKFLKTNMTVAPQILARWQEANAA